jgi:hypothetical protein
VQIAKEADFLTGLQLIGGAGNPTMKEGLAYLHGWKINAIQPGIL